ncbi:helix-turn-helix domain-containing protein [Vibrio sp. F74]|uniref:helix-turn-helix domain-containing protein n=1 Tax=Vibrio sp. F74 TaxID=700020 RepID=UPI0035F56F80
MIHWLQAPELSNVAQYIECYWFIEKRPDATSHQYPKLNPDPSAHLILSPSNQEYRYDMNPAIVEGKGSHWLFPHQQTLQLDHSQAFVHLGIKFRIGALYSLKIPTCAHPMLDAVEAFNLTSLFSMDGLVELDLIDYARNDPNLCCAQLDKLLQPWLENSKEDQHSALTNKILPLLGNTLISDLSSALFCSQRTLERSFSRVTGLTLKQCQTMNKLEQMLEYLYQRSTSEIDWVEIAFQFGFSDQPHLIRHLKKQIGLTPKNYAKERGFTIDVYGGVSSS